MVSCTRYRRLHGLENAALSFSHVIRRTGYNIRDDGQLCPVDFAAAMALPALLLAFLAFSTSLLAHAEVLSLTSLSWTLKNQNGSIAIPAQVPSQAHLDLLRAGIITEPLLGINGMFRSVSSSYCKLIYVRRIHSALDCE